MEHNPTIFAADGRHRLEPVGIARAPSARLHEAKRGTTQNTRERSRESRPVPSKQADCDGRAFARATVAILSRPLVGCKQTGAGGPLAEGADERMLPSFLSLPRRPSIATIVRPGRF